MDGDTNMTSVDATADDGYNPNKSKITNNTLADFLRSNVTGDLIDVPGLGPAGVKQLATHDIYTTYQLVGAFLALKSHDTDVRQHCDLFWYWLKTKGIRSHRSAIVMCIAEKVNTFLPGIYDASVFAE